MKLCDFICKSPVKARRGLGLASALIQLYRGNSLITEGGARAVFCASGCQNALFGRRKAR